MTLSVPLSSKTSLYYLKNGIKMVVCKLRILLLWAWISPQHKFGIDRRVAMKGTQNSTSNSYCVPNSEDHCPSCTTNRDMWTFAFSALVAVLMLVAAIGLHIGLW